MWKAVVSQSVLVRLRDSQAKNPRKPQTLNPFFLQFPHQNLSHTYIFSQELETQIIGLTITKINRLWNIIVAVLDETKASRSLIASVDSSQKQIPSLALRTEQAYMMPPCMLSKPLTICWQELPELDVAPMNFVSSQWISLPLIYPIGFWTHMSFQHPQYHVAKYPTA